MLLLLALAAHLTCRSCHHTMVLLALRDGLGASFSSPSSSMSRASVRSPLLAPVEIASSIICCGLDSAVPMLRAAVDRIADEADVSEESEASVKKGCARASAAEGLWIRASQVGRQCKNIVGTLLYLCARAKGNTCTRHAGIYHMALPVTGVVRHQ